MSSCEAQLPQLTSASQTAFCISLKIRATPEELFREIGLNVHLSQLGVGKIGISPVNFERECTVHTQIVREIPPLEETTESGSLRR